MDWPAPTAAAFLGGVLLDVSAEPWYRDSGWWQLVLSIGALIGGVGVWWWRGRDGRRELRRIYRRAILLALPEESFRDAALSIISDGHFFEAVIVPNRVSRCVERGHFCDALRTRLPSASAQVDAAVNRLFDHLLDGYQHSQYPAWRERYSEWRSEIDSGGPNDSDGRTPGYLVLTLMNSRSAAETLSEAAKVFFTKRPAPVPRIGARRMIQGDPGIESDPDRWRTLLVDAVRAIRRASARQVRIDLVLGTGGLWALALGTRLNNRFGLTLYYFEHSCFHRLWCIDRRIKNLRSPSGERPVSRVLQIDWHDESPSAAAEAIVLSIGANEIEPPVRRYLLANGRAMPVRVITRRRLELDPAAAGDWLQAAAEIASAIAASTARDIYLFADMPAALGLMIGDALGDSKGRLHLMQWDKDHQSYVEALVLPDEELIRMLG